MPSPTPSWGCGRSTCQGIVAHTWAVRRLVPVLAILGVGCAPEPAPELPNQPPGHSNPKITRFKLEQIGQALLLYREDYPAKPVSQWKTIADAGLPPSPLTLLRPGQPWSINQQDLHYEPAQTNDPGLATSFGIPYVFTNFAREGYFQRNGKRQILFYDPYHPGFKVDGKQRRTVVLRWDGTVEEVEFSVDGGPSTIGDLLEK